VYKTETLHQTEGRAGPHPHRAWDRQDHKKKEKKNIEKEEEHAKEHGLALSCGQDERKTRKG